MPDRHRTPPPTPVAIGASFDQFERAFSERKLELTRAMAFLWLAVHRHDEQQVAERRNGVKAAAASMRAFCNHLDLTMDTFEITFPPTENKPEPPTADELPPSSE